MVQSEELSLISQSHDNNTASKVHPCSLLAEDLDLSLLLFAGMTYLGTIPSELMQDGYFEGPANQHYNSFSEDPDICYFM